jgi:RNA polymerase sigma factor (TIGR02999 family)
VNEALLRIFYQQRGNQDVTFDKPSPTWVNREQFLGVAAICMRRVLVDHARARGREKRGGNATKMSLDAAIAIASADGVDVLDLDDALHALAESFPRQSRVVELRTFAGLELEHIASVCGISLAQVKRDWTFARAWLKAKLDRESGNSDTSRSTSA